MADNQPNHAFILNPSSWLGEGKIQLNMVEEELAFFTKWNVAKKDETGKIECVQEIQVKGLSDIMQNQFLFYDLSPGAFIIDLENVALGKITGSGINFTGNLRNRYGDRIPYFGLCAKNVYQ